MGHSKYNPGTPHQSCDCDIAACSDRESDRQVKRASKVYRALTRFQQYQFNNYSCSAATVAMLVNGARQLLNHGGGIDEIHQQEILKRVTCGHWAQRVSDAGYRGRHGLPFSDFAQVVKASFRAFGIPFAAIEAVATPPKAAGEKARQDRLRSALASMARTDRELIGAYFTQGVFIGQWHGHHISPVGAYNTAEERVLILDVDAERFEPYWVTLECFYEGLLGLTNIFNDKGGGYVRILL